MRILLLILVFFACQTNTSKGEGRTYTIKQDGILVEKRYVDDKNRTISIVTYDMETKNPTDSISFNYVNQEELGGVKAYLLRDGKYEEHEPLMVDNFYREIYGVHNELCNAMLVLRCKLLLEDVISNICGIQSSVLPDGRKVSSLAMVSQNSDVVEIKYADINARFNNLSEILQSYFYNQIMLEFSIVVKNGYLQSEEYTFIGGVFARALFYDTGHLIRSEIDVKYKNGETMSCTIVYEPEKE